MDERVGRVGEDLQVECLARYGCVFSFKGGKRQARIGSAFGIGYALITRVSLPTTQPTIQVTRTVRVETTSSCSMNFGRGKRSITKELESERTNERS